MTDKEWDTFSMLLDKGFKWREQFGEAHAFTYRTLLDGYDAVQISDALRALIAQGQKFGPTPGEIIAEIRRDPSKPTFDEALVLVRKALRAWNLPVTGDYGSEMEVLKARHQNVLDRANGMHPLVAAFVDRYGVERLQKDVAELGDEKFGGARANQLRQAWGEHCEALEGREVAAIATGRRGEMGRLDPLAAIKGFTGPPRQIGSGSGA